MGEALRRARRLSSFQIISLGFAAVDLVGALALMLPLATQSRCVTPFREALFTSTSALCVTGLVVRDTGSYWSVFGQSAQDLLKAAQHNAGSLGCAAGGRHRAAYRLYPAGDAVV